MKLINLAQLTIIAICLFFLPFQVLADVVVPSDRVTSALNVRHLTTGEIVGQIPKGGQAQYMNSISGYYIVMLSDGTLGKVAKSWSRKVEGSTSSTLKVATFNIQIFGKTKAGKPEIMSELAEIVRGYDLVAIQEIKDKDGVVPPAFLELINTDGSAYAFTITGFVTIPS